MDLLSVGVWARPQSAGKRAPSWTTKEEMALALPCSTASVGLLGVCTHPICPTVPGERRGSRVTSALLRRACRDLGLSVLTGMFPREHLALLQCRQRPCDPPAKTLTKPLCSIHCPGAENSQVCKAQQGAASAKSTPRPLPPVRGPGTLGTTSSQAPKGTCLPSPFQQTRALTATGDAQMYPLCAPKHGLCLGNKKGSKGRNLNQGLSGQHRTGPQERSRAATAPATGIPVVS